MAVGFLSHRSRFDSNRPCRLPPAQEGMKLGTLVGGRVRVSLAPAAPPLDSRFRGNDETGRFNALVGGGVCGSFSPRIPLPWIPAFAGMTNWEAGMRMVGRRTVLLGRAAGRALSWGQAPALHFLPPLPAASSRLGKYRLWGDAFEVDLSTVCHSNHEVGDRKHYSVAEATVGR